MNDGGTKEGLTVKTEDINQAEDSENTDAEMNCLHFITAGTSNFAHYANMLTAGYI